MIGKVKLTRDGGYDPENPQPDPTLEPPRPARDGEKLSDGEIADLLDDYGRDERAYQREDCTEYGRNPALVTMRDIEREKSRAEVLAAFAALRAELAEATVERRAADYLAGVCSLAVHRHKIDARSEIGDALLDYASTRYGDSNPIGGVDATYQKLRAARADTGETIDLSVEHPPYP